MGQVLCGRGMEDPDGGGGGVAVPCRKVRDRLRELRWTVREIDDLANGIRLVVGAKTLRIPTAFFFAQRRLPLLALHPGGGERAEGAPPQGEEGGAGGHRQRKQRP